MKRWFVIVCSLWFTGCLLSQALGQELAERYPIIPKPVFLESAHGVFTLDASTTLVVNPVTPETRELVFFIANLLSAMLSTQLKVSEGSSMPQKGAITVIVDKQSSIKPEGYYLSVTPDAIIVKSSTVTGAFWGFQTVRQLMLIKVIGNKVAIPCVTVQDYPRFSYRGLLLDVSRHMFPVEFIKKYIDVLSFYKLNTFHWHLTDDQGWRIEIKKYPRLQEIAGYRDETLIGHSKSLWQSFDKTRYGGYYTQEQIKEIVEYARLRHVTVIPEIELPGHSLAALSAYPELGCTGGPYKAATKWGIFDDVYCVGREKTFEFLSDVLTEVLELFPSRYIHIGGDEVRKGRWNECAACQARMKVENLKDADELQSYFIRRIEKFLNEKGRQIIGWDEILEGGLAPRAVVMSWRGIQGGIRAARLEHNVIMTPNKPLYFDHYQSHSAGEPLAIGGHTTLKDVYYYEPIPAELTGKEAGHILGAQANVWTEYIATLEQVEYMTYPRALALAEITWTPAPIKNYENFITRLRFNVFHLKAMNVHHANHYLTETDFVPPTVLENMKSFLRSLCRKIVNFW